MGEKMNNKFRNILIAIVLIIGLSITYCFSAEVPAKPFRGTGMVTDAHAKVHQGQLYRTGYLFESVASGATATFLIDLATSTYTRSATHGMISVVSEPKSYYRAFKDPVIESSGTIVDSYNMNDTISDAPQSLFYHSPNIVSSGTLVTPTILISTGTTFNSGLISRDGTEYIGANGSIYLLEIENNDALAADIGIYIDFYEVE